MKAVNLPIKRAWVWCAGVAAAAVVMCGTVAGPAEAAQAPSTTQPVYQTQTLSGGAAVVQTLRLPAGTTTASFGSGNARVTVTKESPDAEIMCIVGTNSPFRTSTNVIVATGWIRCTSTMRMIAGGIALWRNGQSLTGDNRAVPNTTYVSFQTDWYAGCTHGAQYKTEVFGTVTGNNTTPPYKYFDYYSGPSVLC